jgi:hypothetical protein
MKKLAVLSVLSLFILIYGGQAFAGVPKVVYGPQVFERERGGPDSFSGVFSACDPAGSFKVIVDNGNADGKNMVSSATVSINGLQVVGQNDFNQNAAHIEKPVYGIKMDGNTVDVRLASAPGSRVTVRIEGIMHCLEVHITSLENGGTISDYGTFVKGTIETQDGTEVGVTVNGVPAEVSGKAFAIAGVPLVEGENTIAVKATDEDGNTADDSIKVTLANAASNPVYFTAYPASGQAPLDVKFTVDDTIPRAKVLYQFDWEGDGVVDETAQQLSDFTSGIAHTYPSEGLYFPSVAIKDADGNIYFKAAMINIFKMPDLIKKWDGMKSALEAGDVQTAANSFSLSTRDAYQKQFQVLKDAGVLADVVANMGDMQIVKTMGNAAEGDMRVMQDGKEYSFYVLFVKDDDGIWRIKSF